MLRAVDAYCMATPTCAGARGHFSGSHLNAASRTRTSSRVGARKQNLFRSRGRVDSDAIGTKMQLADAVPNALIEEVEGLNLKDSQSLTDCS